MNRKISALAILLLLIPMFTIGLSQAVPLKEKNNDKFQSYNDEGTYNLLNYQTTAEFRFVPSYEEANKLVVDVDEVFDSYEITVGSNTYYMGTDFAYTGHVKSTYFDPIFGNPSMPKQVTDSRATDTKVTYMFDFSAFPGGIEGTLNMHAVFTKYGGITSLSGTGDLQNVKIQAANLPGSVSFPFVTVRHAGWVSGWPE